MAATSLAGKVDAGLPFAVDLKLVDSAAPGLDGLEALRPLAAGAWRSIPAAHRHAGRSDDGAPAAGRAGRLARRPDVERQVAGQLSAAHQSASGDPASRAIEAMRTALQTWVAPARRSLPPASCWPSGARRGRRLAGGLGDRVAADKAIATLTGRLVDRLNATATRP